MNIFAILGSFIVVAVVVAAVSMVQRGHGDVLVFLAILATGLISGGIYLARRLRRAIQGAFARHSIPRV